MGMSALFLIDDKYKNGLTVVWFAMMTLSLVPSCYQYQFVLDFIILRYPDFNISLTAFTTFLSIYFSSCNVYSSDNNLTT